MPAQGVFIAQGSVDGIFEELLKSCEGLKRTKIDRVDRVECEIEGKSKTSLLTWGSLFQASVRKDPLGAMVVVETLSLIPNVVFIEDLYKAFSKRIPCSKLQTRIVNQTLADSKLDRRKDLVMSGEGAPALFADIPDESRKVLPQTIVCKKCSAQNSADSNHCGNCGCSLVGCQNCGHVPEDGMTFCTKCGNPLN